jgi:hypothetical protein
MLSSFTKVFRQQSALSLILPVGLILWFYAIFIDSTMGILIISPLSGNSGLMQIYVLIFTISYLLYCCATYIIFPIFQGYYQYEVIQASLENRDITTFHVKTKKWQDNIKKSIKLTIVNIIYVTLISIPIMVMFFVLYFLFLFGVPLLGSMASGAEVSIVWVLYCCFMIGFWIVFFVAAFVLNGLPMTGLYLLVKTNTLKEGLNIFKVFELWVKNWKALAILNLKIIVYGTILTIQPIIYYAMYSIAMIYYGANSPEISSVLVIIVVLVSSFIMAHIMSVMFFASNTYLGRGLSKIFQN